MFFKEKRDVATDTAVLNTTAVADGMYRQIWSEVTVKAANAARWFPVTQARKVKIPAVDESDDQTWVKGHSDLKCVPGRRRLEIIFHRLLWDFFTRMIAGNPLSHTLAQLCNYFKLFFRVKRTALPWRHDGNYSTRGQRETKGSGEGIRERE